MKSLEFRQDSVVEFFEEAYGEEADRVMAEAAVLDLVRRREISAMKGADLLGLHLLDFVEIMARYDVAYFTEPLRDPAELEAYFNPGSE